MDIRTAARALGGDVVNRNTVAAPGPGHSTRDRSMSVTFDPDAPDGFVVASHANDRWQDCRDHVRQALGLGDFRPGRPAHHHDHHRRVEHRVDVQPPAGNRADFAMALWKEAKPIKGTPVETYLTGRGICIAPVIYSGHALRFHMATPFRLDSGEVVRLPSMLGAMTNATTGEFQGLHRTALKSDGTGKAHVRGLDDPKKMLGSSAGAVVRLTPDEDMTTGLAIAEGIETSLAVLGNFGFGPIWSTLSAGTMAHFPVLPGIEALTVFADNDKPKMQGGRPRQAGNEAARQCVERWLADGREATVWLPPDIGSDFADIGRAA
jgi:putative DNA primase/helicase